MTKIKICGLSRLCDIEAINAAKPDYIGFVFAESRRRVTFSQAEDLKKHLSPNILSVGVFVNETTDNIMSLIRLDIINTIQLHGNESEEYIQQLKSLTDKPVIKAVSITEIGDAQKWENTNADYLLFDNKGGGTGQVFNWDLIGEVNKPYFMAGGLNIENVKMAIQELNPFAVDISGGVETSGFKDSEKIKSTIRRIRNE